MKTITFLLLLGLVCSSCYSVSAKLSRENKRCEVGQWSAWSSMPTVGCNTVTRARNVTRNGINCEYELTHSKQKCVRPTALETANAIGERFLGKFSPSAWAGRLGGVSPPPADLLFVIDKSSSIGSKHFRTVTDHVQELISLFPVPVAADQVRIAVISFSSHDQVDLDFDFNACDNKFMCSELVGQIEFEGGLTYTRKALIKAREEAFTTAHGSRPNAEKVLFLVTDGRSNDHGDLVGAANALKDGGVELYALGVTNSIDEDELKSIVSEPAPEHLFYYTSFNAMGRGGRFLQARFG